MKRILAAFFFLALVYSGEAQDTGNLPAAAPVPDSTGHQRTSSSAVNRPKKPDFHVTLGMDFSTASGYGSGFTQYVVPTVSYPIGKRFLISGGLVIANTNYFNARPLYSGDMFQPYNGHYTSLTLFGSGTYFVNDKLTISGSFYKEFPVSGQQLSYSPYYPISKQGSQGFSVQAQYRIGKHMFIQAGFEMNQGYDPYNINPYAPSRRRGWESLNFGGLPQSMYNIFSP